MDAALNDFMFVGVDFKLRDKITKSGSLKSEFEISGQLQLAEFKTLRNSTQEKDLELRCEFGNFIVRLKNLEYDSANESFTLFLVEKD